MRIAAHCFRACPYMGSAIAVGCDSHGVTNVPTTYRVMVLADGDGGGTITSASEGPADITISCQSGRISGSADGSVERGNQLGLTAQSTGASAFGGGAVVGALGQEIV